MTSTVVFREKFFNKQLKNLNTASLNEFLNNQEQTDDKFSKTEAIQKISTTKLHIEFLKEWANNNPDKLIKFHNKLILKQIGPDTLMAAEANKLLDAFVSILKTKYLHLKETNLTSNKIIDLIFPGQLAVFAKRERDRFTEGFRSVKNPTKRDLKKFDGDEKLYSIMDYIISEILELSRNAARDQKKHTIAPIHLEFAIVGDKELTQLFQNLFA